jgi:hypothetical protein
MLPLAVGDARNVAQISLPRHKKPLTEHGFLDAAFEDYSGWPLVGVPTGAAGGLDVLDVDLAGVCWFDQHYDQLPPTRAHETRGGGRHLTFRHSEDLRCSASKIAPGVDVRADGGYAVWWPREGFRVVSDAPVVACKGVVRIARRDSGKPGKPRLIQFGYNARPGATLEG